MLLDPNGAFYQLECELSKMQMLDETWNSKSLRSNNLETENSVHGKENTENAFLKGQSYKKINPQEEKITFCKRKLK